MKRLLIPVVLAAIAAAAILGYASNRRESTYRGLIERGDAALARGEHLPAVEAFTVAIALKPESMLGYLKRGEAYRRSGELETALKDLRTASQIDRSATRPLELLGDVEHALGRYDRAVERYQQYVEIDDRSPRLLYKLALSRYESGDTARAVEALRAAIKIDDQFAQAHYLLGLCLEILKKPDQARASFHRAVDLAPALLEAREGLAELHRKASRQDDRIFQLDALRALDPGSASRYVALGLAHAEAGQFDRAVMVLGRAAELFPADSRTYVALGRVWLEVFQARRDPVALQKAIEALERGTSSDGSSEALTLLGKAMLLSEQPDRAVEALAEASTQEPVDPLAFYYLADAAERIGNFPVARDALLDYQALEGDPVDDRRRAHFFQRIGDVSARAGDAADAVTWFERSAAADPSIVDAAFLVRFAESQWRAGNVPGARDSIAKALEKEPTNRAGRALLRRLPQS